MKSIKKLTLVAVIFAAQAHCATDADYGRICQASDKALVALQVRGRWNNHYKQSLSEIGTIMAESCVMHNAVADHIYNSWRTNTDFRFIREDLETSMELATDRLRNLGEAIHKGCDFLRDVLFVHVLDLLRNHGNEVQKTAADDIINRMSPTDKQSFDELRASFLHEIVTD